jgi:hypothetical protein
LFLGRAFKFLRIIWLCITEEVEEDLEGNGHGLTEASSRYLLEWTQGSHEHFVSELGFEASTSVLGQTSALLLLVTLQSSGTDTNSCKI